VSDDQIVEIKKGLCMIRGEMQLSYDVYFLICMERDYLDTQNDQNWNFCISSRL
jgi:hypothetical protein